MTNTHHNKQSHSLGLPLIIMSLLIFLPFVAIAQDVSEVTEVMAAMKSLEGGDRKVVDSDKSEGYKSFVQNEYQNIFQNLKELNEKEKTDNLYHFHLHIL